MLIIQLKQKLYSFRLTYKRLGSTTQINYIIKNLVCFCWDQWH